MKTTGLFIVAALLGGPLGAQETKPVPKNSVRVFIPGCSKGFVFTAGPRTGDQPGGSGIPEGTHLRMSGPKEMMAEIKRQQGSRIEITGLIKKGQVVQDGVGIGRGVRITGGPSPSGGSVLPDPGAGQIMIDVEGWRPVLGDCPSR
jgi:hypothetical protein